ncbi:MAG: HEPN domain-containing protein [Candidatus Nanoarchaeia archaeon]
MKESKNWFSKAIKDFDTAKYNIKGDKIDAGLFYLQQSAEKN